MNYKLMKESPNKLYASCSFYVGFGPKIHLIFYLFALIIQLVQNKINLKTLFQLWT